MSIRHRPYVVLALVIVLFSYGMAQEAVEWEYLVVSYGTTYFANPLTDLSESIASRSKVVLFSDLGLTLPSEAVSLQRNMDVLGRFGWELVGVVGSIGGDQQLVFKRLFDAERSASEADRIREEREALIAEFVAAERESEPPEGASLIDLDAVERAQATERRNERDAQRVEAIIDSAVESVDGLALISREVRGDASTPEARPRVSAEIVLDVTASAMVGPRQYRSSLVLQEFERLREALLANGLTEPTRAFGTCPGRDQELRLRVEAVIEHDGAASVVQRTSPLDDKICIPEAD